MKNLIYILFVAAAIASCSKNKDNIKAPEKKILLARSTSVSNTGTNKSIIEYTYDDAGRTTSVIQNKGTASELTYTLTYDAGGNITKLRFVNRGSNGNDYTYDDQNRIISRQGYYDDGSRGSRSAYTYFADRVEELWYDATNTLTNKYQYFYTPDKKDIASEKRFLPSGELTSDLTYTYNAAVKAAPNGLSGTIANKSEHVLEKTVWVQHYNAGKTITQTYNYKSNADGYPESMEYKTSEYPTSSYSYTYEYIVK